MFILQLRRLFILVMELEVMDLTQVDFNNLNKNRVNTVCVLIFVTFLSFFFFFLCVIAACKNGISSSGNGSWRGLSDDRPDLQCSQTSASSWEQTFNMVPIEPAGTRWI